MNNKRRKAIIEISQKIELNTDCLKDILSEEQESYYSMPENLQNSDRGMESEEAQSSLESAIESLEDAISLLEEIY